MKLSILIPVFNEAPTVAAVVECVRAQIPNTQHTMNLWKAFRDGSHITTHVPAPLVVMFLVTLIGALVLTVPVYAAMEAWAGHRLLARDLARDFDGWLLIEPQLRVFAGLQSAAAPAPGEQEAVTLSFVMIVAALLAWLTSSLPNSVLGGGVLLTYADGQFAWRRFLWGAWHWLLALFVLAILFALCSTVIITLGVGILIALQVAQANILTMPALAVVGVVYVALAAAFEYARVIAIANGTRNIFRSLGRAVAFVARQPLQSLGLYLPMTALGLALIPLYANVVAPVIPFEWGVAAIVAQQLFVIGTMWMRLARWASELALYRQKTRG